MRMPIDRLGWVGEVERCLVKLLLWFERLARLQMKRCIAPVVCRRTGLHLSEIAKAGHAVAAH